MGDSVVWVGGGGGGGSRRWACMWVRTCSHVYVCCRKGTRGQTPSRAPVPRYYAHETALRTGTPAMRHTRTHAHTHTCALRFCACATRNRTFTDTDALVMPHKHTYTHTHPHTHTHTPAHCAVVPLRPWWRPAYAHSARGRVHRRTGAGQSCVEARWVPALPS